MAKWRALVTVLQIEPLHPARSRRRKSEKSAGRGRGFWLLKGLLNMQQIVVHAGFHKTWTTTIQSFLMENDKHLWPYMALVMPAHISEVIKFATTHSVIGGPISCDKLRLRMVEFLRSLDIGKKRHLCISAEDLVGLTQGCSGKETYAGSPALMATARDALYEVFGPDLPITFYLSTRNPDRWLRSSYWQNLRSLPLRMAYATFAETCPDAANFDPIIAQTREALGYTPLLPTAMEDRRFMRLALPRQAFVSSLCRLKPSTRSLCRSRTTPRQVPKSSPKFLPSIAAALTVTRLTPAKRRCSVDPTQPLTIGLIPTP